MRRVRIGAGSRLARAALAGAAIAALATGAQATVYSWSSGNYIPGTTSPNPLLSPDSLSIIGGSNKFFSAVSFVNQSGTVNWSAGDIFFASGSVLNQSLWDALGNNGLSLSSGSGLFTNDGIFRKSGGLGSTTVGNIAFVNSGTIDAQTGTIQFSGGNATFNAGTAFTGVGIASITSGAAFNGGFTTANLDFNGGTYTGTAAALTGTADFTAGTFAGGWDVTAGSTLNISGGANKFFGAGSFTNDGTLAWSAGDLYLSSGPTVTNNGTITATGNNGIYLSSGTPSFINDGLFQKTGGLGTTTIANVGFTNSGTIDAQTGTIRFAGGDATFNDGTAFTGAGIVSIASNAAFNGGFTTANLDFNGGVYTGTAAALTGTADFTAGTFAGGWTVTAGSTLEIFGGANKFFSAGSFTNDGTLAWSAGDLYLSSGENVTNNGTITATSDNGIYLNSGTPSFVNDGLFQKTGGLGTTTIANVGFVNSGTIDAQTGTIRFSGGDATFNAGTAFTGAGIASITSGAAFNGGFTTANLDFNGGTYTGTAAALTGTADFTAGTFAGGWDVTAGSTLNISGGANKFFGAGSFTNDGTLAWSAGSLYLSSGPTVTNNGTITATGNDGIYLNSGTPSFVNNGLIQKTGGLGTTTIGSGIGFDNNGAIDVRTGTIALPTSFANDGTLAGSGTYSVSGTLTNNGTMAPGNGGTGIGTLTVAGNYAQTALGTLSIQLSSLASSDLLAIAGTASLGGTLALFCQSCTLNTGDLFTILDSSGDLSGLFANVTTSGFNPGFGYSVLYDTAADRVQLRVDSIGAPPAAVPEPASWMMMILGMGAVGSAMRRRRAVARVVTA